MDHKASTLEQLSKHGAAISQKNALVGFDAHHHPTTPRPEVPPDSLTNHKFEQTISAVATTE